MFNFRDCPHLHKQNGHVRFSNLFFTRLFFITSHQNYSYQTYKIWYTCFPSRGPYSRRVGKEFNFRDLPHLHEQNGLPRFARNILA